MYPKLCAVIGVIACLSRPVMSRADLFETARQQTNVTTSATDFSGMSLRGGVNLSTGQAQNSQVLRGQASIGGGCNAFDFATSFREAFESIPAIIEGLAQQLLSNMPMLVLCYSSPSLCDLVKHFQGIVSAMIDAKYANCQSAQNAAMYAGLKLRNGQVTQCLDEQRSQGASISRAMDVCNKSAFSLRNPDGTMGREIRLVQDTLRAAGASSEMQTLAGGLLGEVTLRAGDQFGVESRHPQDALLGRYERHKEGYDAALRQAADELRQTGSLSTPTMRAVAVPGQPLPRAAIEALATMRNDPTRYPAMAGRLSTGMALTQLTWECTELQEKLAAAMAATPHLGEEERLSMEKQVQALRQTLASLMMRTDVVEKHYVPAVDALMREYHAMQQAASQAGIQSPSIQIAPSRYGHQSPLGYTK